MKRQAITFPLALALTAVAVACGDAASDSPGSGGSSGVGGSAATGGGSSTGGQQSTGGSSSSGGADSCSNTPCGGDLVGTWTVTSSCLTVSGEVDLSPAGIDCTRGPITAGALQVTGTFTANADTTFSDETTTTGNVDFTLPDQCLNVSGTRTTCDGLGRSVLTSIGFASDSKCQDAAGGGCTCQAPVSLTGYGKMGIVSMMPLTSGNYSTAGSVVTFTDGFETISYSYCVSGNTLTLTPQTTLPITTGAIVLQKQ
ncbi:MAG: hypothetical protein JW940_31325 [Polyangiaceae bacterium]|nr:hypothetical protein [Polyangiaceae bacterium]